MSTLEEDIVKVQTESLVDADDDLLEVSVKREPPKINDNIKELRRFRGQRTAFIWIVLAVIIIHNCITIGLLLYIVFSGAVQVNFDILIPSYFVNVTAQVFALMKAFASYFDKGEFLE